MLDPNGKLPEGVEPVVMPVALTSLVAISVCRVSVPKDLRPHENRLSVLLAIQVCSLTTRRRQPCFACVEAG